MIATKLKNFRETFMRQLPAKLDAVREAHAALGQGVPAKEAVNELYRCFHTLRGESANFGLHALSAQAAEGEHLARRLRKGEAGPESAWRPQVQELIGRLEREAARTDAPQAMDLQALEVVAAAETFHEMERKVVYLCEYDSLQRLNLATQIGCFGFEVVTFGELEQFRNAVRGGHPDAIVMDLVYPGLPTGGADVMREVRPELEREIPTVFISSLGDLPSRLAALRAGSDAYFVKPVNITRLCTALHALTTRETAAPYRIMIVDDDQLLTEMTALTLREAGMETRSLNDPLQALPLLQEFKPDLILMDMHMPGCSGAELTRAIRQIDTCFSIPIIFLSSETNADTQFEARRMGGDEFLLKPIRPDHLISSVTALAGRMKAIRSSMTTDAMTGLFNHTATKKHLDRAIEEALSRQETLCFAMIDLDHFKEINDQYGRAAGDRVLMALARLLRQRLRTCDVVGRTGGEEFAVILPDCGIMDAGHLLEQILESFAAIGFPVGEEYFNSTFSCGVASLDKFGTTEKLYKAADEALYISKEEGRNRVIAVGCEDVE
ncbi:diguanylate cyclase [Geobacter sp. FeAm09]|uniref:diguanylate cyclase n=1 Tax=Geobacter sp. FeAm09 TaxID=2597769 RepID=UPI00197ACD36|nr:diguanylate cyclase [Geobacter sp. FeAm09]